MGAAVQPAPGKAPSGGRGPLAVGPEDPKTTGVENPARHMEHLHSQEVRSFLGRDAAEGSRPGGLTRGEPRVSPAPAPSPSPTNLLVPQKQPRLQRRFFSQRRSGVLPRQLPHWPRYLLVRGSAERGQLCRRAAPPSPRPAASAPASPRPPSVSSSQTASSLSPGPRRVEPPTWGTSHWTAHTLLGKHLSCTPCGVTVETEQPGWGRHRGMRPGEP